MLIGYGGGRLWSALVIDGAADADEIIGNHSKPDPALHAGLTPISTAVRTPDIIVSDDFLQPIQYPIDEMRYATSPLRTEALLIH